MFYSVSDIWFVFLAVCDFDTVCDLQARAVKNFEAASKRHAAGLAKEGIASPDGDDPSDGEEAGDVSRGGAESGRPSMRAEIATNTPVATTAATTPAAATPSRKGKEKVGASGGSVTFQILTRMSLRLLMIPRVILPQELVEVNAQLRIHLIVLLDPLSGHQGWCSMSSFQTRRVLASQLSLKLLFKRMFTRIMLRGLMQRCLPLRRLMNWICLLLPRPEQLLL